MLSYSNMPQNYGLYLTAIIFIHAANARDVTTCKHIYPQNGRIQRDWLQTANDVTSYP